MTEDQQVKALSGAVNEYHRVEYYYVCTDCDCSLEEDDWTQTDYAASEAYRRGWRCLNGLVFCPACLKEQQEQERQGGQS